VKRGYGFPGSPVESDRGYVAYDGDLPVVRVSYNDKCRVLVDDFLLNRRRHTGDSDRSWNTTGVVSRDV